MQPPPPGNSELDQKVVRELVSSGIFNFLQARMFANLSEAVQNSALEVMKPQQRPQTDMNHQLAAIFVTLFLTRGNLSETKRSVKAEMKSLLPERPPQDLLCQELRMNPPNPSLSEFLNDWFQEGEEIVEENKEAVLQAVERRFELLPMSSRRSSGRSSSRLSEE